jgi:hypothetical protein
MVDLPPDPFSELGRHRTDGLRPAGPVAEPGDTWSDDTPALPSPAVRGVHGGGTARRYLVPALGVVVVLVAMAAALWPWGASPQLTVVLRDSASAVPIPTTTVPPVPTTVSTTTTAPRKTTTTVKKPPQWTTLTVNATKVWHRGDTVQTNRTKLTLQSSGDLVIIDEFGKVRWDSQTGGHGQYAMFQSDGNLVVYDRSFRTAWSSNTGNHSGATLVLQANGDVDIVYRGSIIWASHTAH